MDFRKVTYVTIVAVMDLNFKISNHCQINGFQNVQYVTIVTVMVFRV